MANKNTRSRKYLLTFNNPIEHCYSHDMINTLMKNLSYIYYCLCDEIGENGTYHTHLYFICKNAVSWDRVTKIFPTVHIDVAKGSSTDNRDYIRKEGKYLNSDKKDTNLIDTFEEYGEIPLDKSERNASVSQQVVEMIENGCTNAEIIREYPSFSTKIPHLDRIRQTLIEENHRDEWIPKEVIYIYGETGTGKTRSVMDKYGYSNVCKVTNYTHPFDNYNSEDVLLLDEFKGQIPIADLLQYTDGYPCKLPARYQDKTACYKKLFIISNTPLNQQYKDVQIYDPETWNALIRRISKVIRFEFNKGDYPFTSECETVQIEEDKKQYQIITAGDDIV